MRILILASLCICVALAFAAPAMADEILTLNDSFGAVTASGSLEITFSNTETAGQVLVTMDATGLASETEFVSEWYFNFDDTNFLGDATGLTFGAYDNQTTTDVGSWSDFEHGDGTGNGVWGIETSDAQDLQADGDGKYNLSAWFSVAEDSRRFEDGDLLQFYVSGTGISASDFNLIALRGGGNGPFYSAAHVQGTGTDGLGSDWLGAPPEGYEPPGAVPEPTSIALLGLGFAGLVGLRRRRRRD